MKRMIVYTAGLALAGAAFAQSYYDDDAPVGAQGGYPPCSATVTDRCIQLYEPGVATEANLALNERLGDGSQMAAAAPVDDNAYADYDNVAMGGPYEPIEGYEAEVYEPATAYEGVGGPYEEAWANDYALGSWSDEAYPPCSITPTDDRCIQLYEGDLDGYYY